MGLVKVKSKVMIGKVKIKQINTAAQNALRNTAETLHTEIVQAGVIPRDTGAMQDEGTFVDLSKLRQGKVSIVTATPYARRWYFNPEGVRFHRANWQSTVKRRKGPNKGKTVTIEHDGNPNAKDHWYEDWEPGGANGSFIYDSFKENLKREMK